MRTIRRKAIGRKRSASRIVGCAPRCAEPHAETPESVLTATTQRRQTMDESITSFVGLDVHKDSIAIAVAEGRDAPRFLGTVQSELQQLLKAFKGLGKAQSVLVVDEAGPCGYGLYRQLRSRGYGCAV